MNAIKKMRKEIISRMSALHVTLFLTFRSKSTIAVNKLCDCFDILAMKDWNGAEKSLRHQYIVNDLPDCIEPQGKNLLQKMILCPCASYVTFEDNRKTDGYTICR